MIRFTSGEAGGSKAIEKPGILGIGYMKCSFVLVFLGQSKQPFLAKWLGDMTRCVTSRMTRC